jgi:hypothetical protein
MECRLAGETEVLGENLPQRHFCPSQNPTWPNPELNPGRRGGKPATNRLSYGAAICMTFSANMGDEELTKFSLETWNEGESQDYKFWGLWIGFKWLPLEDSDESSFSIKCRQFLASQEEFVCLRLVKCRGYSYPEYFSLEFRFILVRRKLVGKRFFGYDMLAWGSWGETKDGSLSECSGILLEHDWLSKRGQLVLSQHI